MYHFLLNKSKI